MQFLYRRRVPIPRGLWIALIGACAFSFMMDLTSGNLAIAADEHPAGETAAHGDHGEAHGGGEHPSELTPVLLAIVIILVCAKVAGDLFERVGMPAVLGELAVGVLLGNFELVNGWHGFDFMQPPPAEEVGNVYNPGAILKILAEIGVLILLFEVGLESNVKEMISVGVSSLLVAILGVVAPVALGWGVGAWLAPELGWQTHMFMGATLAATSVGITARVLKDIGRQRQRESQIILGAAVIDDIMGLIVLAIVAGIINQGITDLSQMDKLAPQVGLICLKAFGFLATCMLVGNLLVTRPLFKFASYLNGHGLMTVTSLVICFGFAYAAKFVGMEFIVGAFAAGLILDQASYKELHKREEQHIEDAIRPIGALLVPIFFVEMGIQVDISTFGNTEVLLLAGALTFAAIIGKQVCSLGVVEQGRNKLAVGLGMIPRGEVGLIFANIGKTLESDGHPVIDDGTYSAIVVMVMVTTMITPPLLKWAMERQPGEEGTPDFHPPKGNPEFSGHYPAPNSDEIHPPDE